ncbi:MAG: LptF/LptG family permease [Leptonema sp. (in: bacteria)]
MRRFKIIDLYIFKEILAPFFTTLFFWTTLMIILVLKEVIGELIGKGIEFIKILQYIFYLIGEKITHTIPIACLFAGILSTGRLSADSEIIALRASGISFRRIYSVYLAFGMIAMFVVGILYFYIGPISSKAKTDFEEWLRTYHSFSLVKSGRFMNVVDTETLGDYGFDIYVQYRNDSILKNIQIRKWKNLFKDSLEMNSTIHSSMVQIIQAKQGQILIRKKENGEEENFIRLEKGYMIESTSDWTKIEITDFRNGFMDYVLTKIQRKVSKLDVKPDNYTFWELLDFLNKLEKGGHKFDFEALSAGKESIKLEELTSGQNFPSLQELKEYLNLKKIWLIENLNKVNQQGGPTMEEYNYTAQFVFRLELFLKDVEKTKRKFQIEIHRRIAIPVANLLFFFVSFPLGLVSKRTGKGMNFPIAIFVFFFYYSLLTIGLTKGNDGVWSPFLSAWISNIGLFLLGSYIMALKTDDFTLLNSIRVPIKNFYNKYIYEHPIYTFLERKIIRNYDLIKKVVAKIKELFKSKF